MVAIDMRGYGETGRPPSKCDYTIDLLSQDIVELIPALGYSKCILVAHDWGGVVAWWVKVVCVCVCVCGMYACPCVGGGRVVFTWVECPCHS